MSATRLILAAVALWVAAAGCSASWGTEWAENRNGQRCQEDMACWDCRLHGNMLCGPISLDGR